MRWFTRATSRAVAGGLAGSVAPVAKCDVSNELKANNTECCSVVATSSRSSPENCGRGAGAGAGGRLWSEGGLEPERELGDGVGNGLGERLTDRLEGGGQRHRHGMRELLLEVAEHRHGVAWPGTTPAAKRGGGEAELGAHLGHLRENRLLEIDDAVRQLLDRVVVEVRVGPRHRSHTSFGPRTCSNG